MGAIGNDLRYALRQLRKAPGFTLTAVLTLALGIGANAAMFSVIDQVLLRRLPYQDPSRLVTLGEINDQGQVSGGVSLPDAQDWQARSHTLSDVAYYTFQQPTLRGIDQPQLVPQMVTSANFFHLLGVKPAMGRAFLPDENKGDRTHVLVIGNSTWREQFHSDPHVLGRVVKLNETPYTVIGVLPPGFTFQGQDGILFTPIDVDLSDLQSRDSGVLNTLGRLAPTATLTDAQRELDGIRQQAIQLYPEKERKNRVFVKSYERSLTENVRPALLALHGAVLVVWLVACANVAGLLLTRASGRRREIAVRSALGAGNARLLRQFLTESLLLALAGGAVGLGFAAAALRLLRHYLGNLFPNGEQIHINAAVCGYLLLASCVSAVIFGVAPAWQAARVPAQEGLREGSAAAGTSQRQRWLRDALVVGEITFSVVLLVAAGLMLRSLYALRHAELGFAPENVVTAGLVLPQKNFWFASSGPGSSGPNVVQSFYQPLLERLRQLPGVEAAGVSTVRPLNARWSFTLDIVVAGRPKVTGKQQGTAACRAATGEYFSAMGIRLLRGRLFDSSDTPGGPMAAVVNQAFVRRFFPGENPLGHEFKVSEHGPHRNATIVGVVDDAKQLAASEPALPEASMNLLQFTPEDDLYPILAGFRADIAVRARRAPESLIPAIERIVHALNAGVAMEHPAAMQQVIEDSMGSQVLAGRLLTIFGVTALLIATAGIYGLLAYQVSQRTREMGVRIALGAQRGDVVWLVLRHALILMTIGVGAGIVLAMSAGRVIASFLYQVDAHDYVTAAAVALVLAVAGLSAGYLPARRASLVDPVEALRSE